jgi:tetratricopeptide (TPR) repeat protein
MAAHNPHLHHYCWALISKQRYFRANGKTQRDYYFKQFMGDIDYVLNNTADKSWPFFHVLLIEQAGMMNIRGDYPSSLLKIDQALKSKPDYDKAHALRSDVFLAMGDKKKAIEAAQMGLEKDPRSRLLRRRLEQMGIKVPPLPDPVAGHSRENASNAETSVGAASTQQAGKDAGDGSSITTPAAEMPKARESGPGVDASPNMAPAADSSGKNQDASPTGTGSQPGKPYCRFCP